MACDFMQHCRDNAATLPEAHWWAMVGQLVNQTGGHALIHELSRPYPQYRFSETEAKIRHANGTPPHSCEYIKDELGFKCGIFCGVKNPASLAYQKDKPKNHSIVSFEQEPLPLPERLPKVPDLERDLLPPPLAPWMEDIAERAQIPLCYPAAAVVVILSSLIGRKITIRPKRKDDWQVVPNLWGALVGEPSMLKSYSVRQGMKPIKRMKAVAKQRYDEEKNKWLVTNELMQVEAKALKDKFKKKLSDENERLCIQNDLEELYDKMRDQACFERRYYASDITVEKLGILLSENPNGILIVRDELYGFIRTFSKQGHEGAREYHMECWEGDGSVPSDRISREGVAGEGLCTSMIGTMQPGKLTRLVDGALSGELDDDGLIQRLQVLVWPEAPENWEYIDRKPHYASEQRAFELYENLDKLTPEDVHAVYPEFGDLPFLRFDDAGQEIFAHWLKTLQARRRTPEVERAESFAEHLGKYNSLMPSLALVFHLIDCAATGGRGPVSYDAALRAQLWVEFLEAHARKVYAPELALDAQAAHALARKIQDGAVSDGDLVRDIYRNQWARLTTPDDVRSGLKALQELHWLRTIKEGKGQNKAEVVRLHPSLVKA